jgi:hypothetical protein
MFNGRIAGLEIVLELGARDSEIPKDWYQKAEILQHFDPYRDFMDQEVCK